MFLDSHNDTKQQRSSIALVLLGIISMDIYLSGFLLLGCIQQLFLAHANDIAPT